MDKTQKKKIRQALTWIVMAATAAFLAVMPMLAGSGAEADGPVAIIQRGSVDTGVILTDLSAGGMLSEESDEKLTLPESIRLEKYLVKNGEYVQEGAPLARVDRISVMVAISEIQETMDYIAKQIGDADDNKGASQIKAVTPGRVKKIYAQPGDDVRSVMLEHGALAVLSLDGRMAVSIDCDRDYSAGDTVYLSFPGSIRVAGRVESCLAGKLVVTVADNGFDVGGQVQLSTSDNEILGTGELYIHNPWNVTAYYGQVKQINVKENDKVTIGKVLVTLENTGNSTQEEVLNGERQEYEKLLEKLFRIYETGYLTAPCDGYVYGVEKDSPWLLAAMEESWQVDLLTHVTSRTPEVTLLTDTETPPPEIPGEETEPLKSYTVTRAVRTVTETAPGMWLVQAKNLNATVSDLSLLNIQIPVTEIPVEENLSDVRTIDGQPHTVKAGQILLWVSEGGTSYWVYHSASGGMGLPGGFSGFAGFGGLGGNAQQETFEKYDLTEETVLTVTPDKTMTLEISVDELDIAHLRVGQEASVYVPALGENRVPGRITEIGEATNAGGNSKFSVTITMDRTENMLPGMSASAKMELARTEPVLRIPVAALQGSGSGTFVYTGWSEKDNTLTNPVPVVTGISDGEYVQILSGVQEGDTLFWHWYEAAESTSL